MVANTADNESNKDDPFAGSLFLLEGALADSRPRFDSPAALAARNDLAAAYCSADRVPEAVELLTETITACRAVLGTEHPDTLIAEGNLAVAHFCLGEWLLGLQLMTAALTARESVLGVEHPATMTACDALAAAHRLGGDMTEALMLYCHVATQRTRILGPHHPDTYTSVTGLALTRIDAGDPWAAEPLLAAVLLDAEDTLGSDDAITIAARARLAHCHAVLGRIDDAVTGYTQAAEQYQTQLGTNHPDTLDLRHELHAITAAHPPNEVSRSGTAAHD